MIMYSIDTLIWRWQVQALSLGFFHVQPKILKNYPVSFPCGLLLDVLVPFAADILVDCASSVILSKKGE